MHINIYSAYALRFILVFFAVVFAVGELHAQKPPRMEMDLDAFIQTLLPVSGEDATYDELYESLFQLYSNPLNLNTVTSDELAATYILSELQLKSFFSYRQKLGPFLSLYELQAVPNLDISTIYRLIPFVTVEAPSVALRETFNNPTQHFLLLRSGQLLEKQKGFSSPDASSSQATRYLGKPLFGYVRYRYARAGSYSLGFVMEKDAGEKWMEWNVKRHILGADFTSFHAQVLNRGKLKNFIIGDFQMQAGQGLILAAGFSLGKGSEVIRTTYRSTLGIRPYTSVLEANYFRGIAATFTISKRMDVTAFASGTRRDASYETDSHNPENRIITSLLVSGYHRTPAECEKHGIIPERNAGLHMLYQIPANSGQIGLTILNTAFGSFFKKRNDPYNQFEFEGKHNLVIGIHGDYHWQNFHFFGEAARSKEGGKSGIGGLIVALGKKLDITALVRHYDRHFHSFYANSISESTRPINETAVYGGIRYAPLKQWQFSGFYDYFKFPWLKFQVNAPSKGSDFYLHTLWKPNKQFNVYGLFHQKNKQRNLPGETTVTSQLVEQVRRTAVVNAEYAMPLKFSVRTRIQGGDLAYKGFSRSKGFAVAQDITWHCNRLELSGRVALFNTDNYDSRQYVYEKDMLYAFSLPAYYDKGWRHFLMMRYAVTKQTKLWLRWSQTRYSDLETISSGLNEIKGNKRSEVKAQLMYQF